MGTRHQRRWWWSILPLVVFATAVGAGCSRGGAEQSRGLLGVVRDPALSVGGVTLLDSSGDEPRPISLTPPTGELYVLYFGYTSCPDVCPTTLADLRVALDELPVEQAAKVTVGMTSVDPERDTPDVVRRYLAHFFDRALPLSATDPAALAAAAQAFGVRYEVAEHEPGSTGYDVSHTAVTYVVDDSGKVAVEWPFGFDSDEMAKDLLTLLKK